MTEYRGLDEDEVVHYESRNKIFFMVGFPADLHIRGVNIRQLIRLS